MKGNPTAWARYALMSIAEKRLAPTPEHFAKFYYEAGGDQGAGSEKQAVDLNLFSRLNELVSRAAAATEELSTHLGEHERHLTTSVARQPGRTTDPAELLRAVERLSDEIQSTVKASQAELIATRESLNSIRIELEKSRELSSKDPLTGSANRRAMDETLAKELRACRRSGECLSVVLLDIDHFKAINDVHGHAVGDAALVHVAGLAKSLLRGRDAFFRFGGEEFLLVLPETRVTGAIAIADRFRAMLARHPLLHEGMAISMTFSGGATELSTADTPASLVERADRALYQAKQTGRNRVLSDERQIARATPCFAAQV